MKAQLMNISFWWLFVVFLFPSSSFCQLNRWAPPDTLLAHLFIIKNSNAPDSIQGAQLRQLLTTYHMDTTAYRQFYEAFIHLPIKEQQKWLKKAATIIRQEAIKTPVRKPRPVEIFTRQRKQAVFNRDGNE